MKVEADTSATTIDSVSQSLAELVTILLDNAIKYSQPQTTVMISTTAADEHLTLTVQDHGRGIAAAELPHIFDRFWRADASRTGGGPVGMVWVSPSLNRLSIFTMAISKLPAPQIKAVRLPSPCHYTKIICPQDLLRSLKVI